MAIRYFLSLSCLFHALALIFFLSLYPSVSAEALRKEIVVYIVEPLVSSNRAEEEAGTIETHTPAPIPVRVPVPVPAPVIAQVRVENGSLSIPTVREEERELLLPVGGAPAEGFVETGSKREVADLPDKGEGGLFNSGDSTRDGAAFQGDVKGVMTSMAEGTPMISDPKTSLFSMEKFRDLLLGEISGRKTYPASARKLGIEGEVHINFRVFPDGQFRDISANGKQERLTILEKAAIELIRNVSPFPLPPSSDVHNISAEGVPMQLVISYQLEEKKGEGRE